MQSQPRSNGQSRRGNDERAGRQRSNTRGGPQAAVFVVICQVGISLLDDVKLAELRNNGKASFCPGLLVGNRNVFGALYGSLSVLTFA